MNGFLKDEKMRAVFSWYPLNVFYVTGYILKSPHHMRILTNANISSFATYVKITEINISAGCTSQAQC